MYKLAYYTETNDDAVLAFIKQYPFAVIIGNGNEYPVATHIPMLIKEEDGKLILEGHIMRKTDHHLAFEKDNNVLVVFNGPHTHVSASWYTTQAMGSTWNYMTVHAKGKMIFTDDAGTIDIVHRLTDKYEGKEAASSFDKLTNEYVQQMVKAIVGFSIEVTDLQNVFKLSQNRDEPSRLNIIAELKKRGDDNSVQIASEIEQRM